MFLACLGVVLKPERRDEAEKLWKHQHIPSNSLLYYTSFPPSVGHCQFIGRRSKEDMIPPGSTTKTVLNYMLRPPHFHLWFGNPQQTGITVDWSYSLRENEIATAKWGQKKNFWNSGDSLVVPLSNALVHYCKLMKDYNTSKSVRSLMTPNLNDDFIQCMKLRTGWSST